MLARLTKRVAFLTLVIVLAAGTLASQTAPAQRLHHRRLSGWHAE